MSKSTLARQLPLALSLNQGQTFDRFYAGPNALLISQLQEFLLHGERIFFLVANAGAGKTHLAQAACHVCSEQGLSPMYLPLRDMLNYSTDVLEGLEAQSVLVIDDVDTIAERSDWNEALFHLLNRLWQKGGKALVTANAAPSNLPFVLADLQSRLNWGGIFALRELDDDAKAQALIQLAQQRGIELEIDSAQYILRRYSRDFSRLLSLLARLDFEALAAKRKVTLPFIRSVLELDD